jgi:hypothetical protein
MLGSVAVPYQMYSLAHSTIAVGALGLASLLRRRASVVSGGVLCIARCLATVALLPAYRHHDSTRSLA